MSQNQKKDLLFQKYKLSIQLKINVNKFMYSQSHIIATANNQIIIYNTLTKISKSLHIQSKQFIIQQMPPHLFVIIIQQIIYYPNQHLQQIQELQKIKISKLQPQCICRYNKGYFMGGYNKSKLPGNKRTNRKSIYYLQNLTSKQKNIPQYTIDLKKNQNPVSILIVQNPYLLAYCKPTIYLISINHKQIVLTFQKQILNLLVLEGRFATSSFNGIGISQKGTIFNFDVQRFPLYGVQVTQNNIETTDICLQRTGRIFGCYKNILFQYHPLKRTISKKIAYKQNCQVIGVECSPTNYLMVLRRDRQQNKSFIQIFSLQ